MKILLINKFFFLNGGSERVFFQERSYLLEKGINVIDFSMDDYRNFPSDYSKYFVSSVDYHSSSGLWKKFEQATKFIFSFEAINSINRLINHENIDIAHLHNIYHQLTPSIIPILKKKGAQVVLTVHDGKLICPVYTMLNQGEICTACRGEYFWRVFVKNCANSQRKSALLMVEALLHKWKRSYDFVDLFIVPSNFMADIISQRIPPKKIYVLRNGIDVPEYSSTYQDDGYALYIGRLSKEKGIKTLLKAHKTIKQKFPLKIVGKGPMVEDLQRSFTNVEFLGYKKGDELKRIISKSAFVVLPSELYENCSMAVLEAMSMGKPVIGSRIGGIPEQIEDKKNGLLFEMGNVDELADKMMILAMDVELRQQMGKFARIKAEKEFSIECHCNKLMKIYNELLSAKFAY